MVRAMFANARPIAENIRPMALNSFEKKKPTRVAIRRVSGAAARQAKRVGVGQRVVQHIRVRVQRLAVGRVLNERIGGARMRVGIRSAKSMKRPICGS